MSNTDFDEQVKGIIGIVSAVVFVFTIIYYKQILSFANSFNNNFWNYLTIIALWVIVLIFGGIILYFIIKLIGRLLISSSKAINYKITHRHDEAEQKQEETEEIEDLLEEKLPISQEELTNYIERLRDKVKACREYHLSFSSEIKKRLANAIKLLEDLEKDERQRVRKNRAEEIDRIYKEALRNKEISEKGERETVERELQMILHNVYKKKGLTKMQQEILKENDYKQITEYCVYERGFITVFVKPELNHSPTHEFLVWSVMKLLKKIKDIKNIQDHLTKNADITFKYHNKKYALEIELGSLLRKQKQLHAKVKYLNDIFKNRWMFVVSNKNLLVKYKKYGFATPRNRVYENLAKMLKIEHLEFSGVKPTLPSAGEW